MALLVFVDTETTGLDPKCDEIWNLYAEIVRTGEPYKLEGVRLNLLIKHDITKIEKLPYEFRKIHDEQYVEDEAISPMTAGFSFLAMVKSQLNENEKAHFIAANPHFDVSFIVNHLTTNDLFFEHFDYHLIDIEMLALGRVIFKEMLLERLLNDPPHGNFLPFKSKDLTKALGINTDHLTPHSARDDVAWIKMLWLNITGNRGYLY